MEHILNFFSLGFKSHSPYAKPQLKLVLVKYVKLQTSETRVSSLENVSARKAEVS